ncbi:MAG: porin family protein [Sphaerochaetaceae bacterium]|nr:porin family protein [Sphaerochaetaceae bacterium]
MNKKLLSLVCAICLFAPVAVSARAFDFNIGATAQFQNDVTTDSFDAQDLTDPDNYRFGAETRLNFLLFEVADTAVFGSSTVSNGTVESIEFTNHLAAGIYKDIFGVLRVGLLAGPEFEMNITDDGVTDENGDAFEFTDIFMKSNFTYKAHVDVLLSQSLTLSASYTLPTEFNLEDSDYTKLIPGDSDWSDGKVGISLLLF